MATIRDVAKLSGTSVSSVSAVLSGSGRTNIRVSEATRERIFRAAEQLKYIPNPLAKSLVTGKTGVLGLVFPYSGAFIDRNPFCTQVMSGVVTEVVEEKYNLMLHTAIGDDWNEADKRSLIDPRVDGLIFVVPKLNNPIVQFCQRAGFPCVALVYETDQEGVCMVNADEREAGRLATQHLIERGHRRIAHLYGDLDVCTSEPRKQGYFDALEAAGISRDESLLAFGSFDWHDGYDSMHQLLDLPPSKRPTAVFAANDLCAEGAMRAINERGLRIPDDIAIVGCDDTWFAELTQPKLTSVHIPILEMGILATQMLIALLEGRDIQNRQATLPVSLTVRESSGA